MNAGLRCVLLNYIIYRSYFQVDTYVTSYDAYFQITTVCVVIVERKGGCRSFFANGPLCRLLSRRKFGAVRVNTSTSVRTEFTFNKLYSS